MTTEGHVLSRVYDVYILDATAPCCFWPTIDMISLHVSCMIPLFLYVSLCVWEQLLVIYIHISF